MTPTAITIGIAIPSLIGLAIYYAGKVDDDVISRDTYDQRHPQAPDLADGDGHDFRNVYFIEEPTTTGVSTTASARTPLLVPSAGGLSDKTDVDVALHHVSQLGETRG